MSAAVPYVKMQKQSLRGAAKEFGYVKMQKQSLRGAAKEFGVHVTTLKNYCDRSRDAVLSPTSPTSNSSSKLSLLKAGHDISINILARRKRNQCS
ncbi:hypothetical protein QE152_g35154 [Popillia japonica]|uniref:HTH psq-type domain-containing protein n=1 Tax=Popillia japonica TaxID=7064 RepID=A0AAW1ISQ6_POPJA